MSHTSLNDSIYVKARKNNFSCDKNEDWGVDTEGKRVWISNGCYATFSDAAQNASWDCGDPNKVSSGKTYCTIPSVVTDFYAKNAFTSKYGWYPDTGTKCGYSQWGVESDGNLWTDFCTLNYKATAHPEVSGTCNTSTCGDTMSTNAHNYGKNYMTPYPKDDGQKITLVKQYSSPQDACIRGYSYGTHGNLLWTGRGCSGNFQTSSGKTFDATSRNWETNYTPMTDNYANPANLLQFLMRYRDTLFGHWESIKSSIITANANQTAMLVSLDAKIDALSAQNQQEWKAVQDQNTAYKQFITTQLGTDIRQIISTEADILFKEVSAGNTALLGALQKQLVKENQLMQDYISKQNAANMNVFKAHLGSENAALKAQLHTENVMLKNQLLTENAALRKAQKESLTNIQAQIDALAKQISIVSQSVGKDLGKDAAAYHKHMQKQWIELDDSLQAIDNSLKNIDNHAHVNTELANIRKDIAIGARGATRGIDAVIASQAAQNKSLNNILDGQDTTNNYLTEVLANQDSESNSLNTIITNQNTNLTLTKNISTAISLMRQSITSHWLVIDSHLRAAAGINSEIKVAVSDINKTLSVIKAEINLSGIYTGIRDIKSIIEGEFGSINTELATIDTGVKGISTTLDNLVGGLSHIDSIAKNIAKIENNTFDNKAVLQQLQYSINELHKLPNVMKEVSSFMQNTNIKKNIADITTTINSIDSKGRTIAKNIEALGQPISELSEVVKKGAVALKLQVHDLENKIPTSWPSLPSLPDLSNDAHSLFMWFIMLILVVLTITGGYYGYKKYQEKYGTK